MIWRYKIWVIVTTWMLPLSFLISVSNLRQTKRRMLRRWRSSIIYFSPWWLMDLKVILIYTEVLIIQNLFQLYLELNMIIQQGIHVYFLQLLMSGFCLDGFVDWYFSFQLNYILIFFVFSLFLILKFHACHPNEAICILCSGYIWRWWKRTNGCATIEKRKRKETVVLFQIPISWISWT